MLLRQLVETWKDLSHDAKWTEPDVSQYCRFYAPLVVDGILEASLVLKGGTYKTHPERHISFELAIRDMKTNRDVRLSRIDWRVLSGGHSNSRRSCRGLVTRTESTHFHEFSLNYIAEEDRMKRRLPCARNVDENLNTFEELREFVGTHFRINDIIGIPLPNWEYRLL